MANVNVDASYVVEHLEDQLIVDLRPEFMFVKAHVPQAKNLDFWGLKAQAGEELASALAGQMEALGAKKDEPVIVYCQVGMTSSAATALLENQGFSELRHYARGWEDWVSDDFRPIEW